MKNRTTQQTITMFLFVSILIQSSLNHCQPGTVVSIQSDFSAVCISCPTGCAVCALNSQQQPHCIFCEDGFYSKIDQTCAECYENCANCVGPELGECKNLKPGFYYDPLKSKIRECAQTGCSSCDETGNCFSCTEGYYLGDDPVGKIKICKSCSIENCVSCTQIDDGIKQIKSINCNVCKSGHSLINGFCEACPDNCQFCIEHTKECILCKPGFTHDSKSNKCLTMPMKNCNALNTEGECLLCENRFYLKDGNCFPCQKMLNKCSYCRFEQGSSELSCLNCESEHFLNEKTCKKCIENCNHCNAEKCFSCVRGFYYNEIDKTCSKCEIDNCELCKTNDVCESCLAGFYFDNSTKMCSKCKNNCLRCTNDSEDCVSCAFNRFSLSEPIGQNKNQASNFFKGFLSLILGKMALGPNMQMTEIHMSSKCVVECPKLYRNKKVKTDNVNRRCV